ncbi:MAG: aminotransferase class I/II-fold pyridoxal phosphate-dependent enzyme, partial [Silvanigrellaceae bacterium]|nr:aminotransferase class I/II-fold pyridoxal phosphate-dependent enzyme [Silvanigrellaceae bacterium]
FKNLLCFFSLSKRSGMTGFRSGFIAGDEQILQDYAKYRINAGLGTPEFVQHAAIAAWGEDSHVQQRNEIFYQKRLLVTAFFQKYQISYVETDATFYVWGKVPSCYLNGQDFAQKLLCTTGIAVTPGEAFGETCQQYFRIALVPPLEMIKQSLDLWHNKIKSGEFNLSL